MSRSAIESPDTISGSGEAFLVDALCEGKIHQLVGGKSGIFLDEVPLEFSDGSTNFSVPNNFFNESGHFTKGLKQEDQSVLDSPFDKLRIALPLPSSNQVKFNQPVSVSFNDNTYPDIVSAIVNLRFQALLKQWDEEEAKNNAARVAGDTTGTSVRVLIEINTNFEGWQTVSDRVINEKSSSGFVISFEVPISPNIIKAINHYNIRVSRLTPDTDDTARTTDNFFVDSLVLVSNSKFKYPHTVLAGIKLNAKQFPSPPDRRYLLDLMEVKVPVNYTPAQYNYRGEMIVNPSYSGIWNGSFKTAWTNNPAWIFYDVITNQRYGLGEFLNADQIDKWTLYNISRYCDAVNENGTFEGVDDGKGGREPRFTCNTVISNTEQAHVLLNNLASIFRGITYWMSGLIFAVQDRPKEFTQIFNNSNVIDGVFDYSTSENRQIRSILNVRWNDPDDFYNTKYEYVEDQESLLKYGVREGQMAAFGTTSRAQAQRVGRWILLTEKLETELVKFKTGYEGNFTRPGDIIHVHDDFRYNLQFGGRTINMPNTGEVWLDRVVLSHTGDAFSKHYLTLTVPKSNRDPSLTGDATNGVVSSDQIPDIRKPQVEKREILSIVESGITSSNSTASRKISVVTMKSGFSETVNNSTWIYEISTGDAQDIVLQQANKYRVINISEDEDKGLEILALQYNEDKFSLVDEQLNVLSSPPTNYAADGVIQPPSGLSLELKNAQNNNTFSFYIEAIWQGSDGPNLLRNDVSGRFGTGDWVPISLRPDGQSARYYINESGNYTVSVGAIQLGGARSSRIQDDIDVEFENPLGSGDVGVLAVSGIFLLNGFLGSSTNYNVQEPQFSFLLDPADDDRRALMAGIRFRILDQDSNPISPYILGEEETTYRLPFNGSLGPIQISGWPLRTGIIEAEGYDIFNNPSSTTTQLQIVNPAPAGGNTISFNTRNKNFFVYNISTSEYIPDFSGVVFWVSEDTNKPVNPTAKVNNTVGQVIHNLNSENVYIWFAIGDNFSSDGLNVDGPFNYSTSDLNLPDEFQISGFETITQDVHGNESSAIRWEWDQYSSGVPISYQLELHDNSGNIRNITHAFSELDPSKISHYDADIIPTLEYSGRLRVNTSDNTTNWSNFSNVVKASKRLVSLIDVSGDIRTRRAIITDESGNARTTVFWDSSEQEIQFE